MAIDDASFYTVTGKEITRNYLVEQMIGYYGLKLEAGETKITDFNEGSEIRNLLESIAINSYIIMEDKNELTKIGFIETAEGEYLDMHGANPSVQLPREIGIEATGYVIFSITEPLTSETVIPEGTIVVNSSNGLEYATLYDAVFSTDETSVTVAIECLTVGEDGNCSVGEIDTIDEILADIPTISVTNETEISGGSDYEEDEEYRQRLLDYKKRDAFGSLPYYMSLADSIKGVHDILIVDASTSDNILMNILVNGNSKPTPSNTLADVLEIYTDINNKVIGHNFTVDTPNYIITDVNLNLNVSVEIDENLIKALLQDIIDGGDSIGVMFEFGGLFIGDNLTDEMVKSNVLLLDGVISADVSFTVGGTDYTEVIVNEDEVIQLGTVNINQTIE